MDISFNHTFFLDGKPFRRTTPGSRTFYKACKNDNPYKNYTSYEYEEQHSFFYSVEIIYVTQDSVFLDINNTWYRFINQNNFFTSWGTCFFFVSTPPPHNDDAYKAITFTTTQTFYQENPSDIWYWVANTFAYTFDFITDLSLRAVAYIADRDNLPFKEIYHLYMNKPWIDTAPMILHSHVTEISHIGKNLYNEHHLPVLFTKHARKHQKTYTHDFYTIQHWLRQIIMRRLNIDYNFTSITESLIRRRWLVLYKLFLFAALLYYHVLYRVLIPVFILPIDTSKFYIDDRNFFGVWVSFVAVSFYQYSLLLPHR